LSRGGFASKYYEFYDHAWAKMASTLSPDDEERIENILRLVPPDCASVLDIGCGDGRVTNRLASRFARVVGVDTSIEALRHVTASAALAAIERLPFPDKTFDLVLCSEVLEHLPYEVYPRALEEIGRCSKKYILITVPNKEDLRENSTVCPACTCRFHPSRHVRSFDSATLEHLFRQFKLCYLTECSMTKVYPETMIRAGRLIGVVPQEPHAVLPPTALCPQCGYTGRPTDCHDNPQSGGKGLPRFLLRVARVLVPRMGRATFLIGLYKRCDDFENSSKE
jgi:SAM-dependent methyltransferase